MAMIRKVLRKFLWAIIIVNVTITVLATVVLLVDVITRNLLGRALPATYDLTEISMLLITATALIWLDAERDNIGFSIVVDRLSEKAQTFVEIFWRFCSIPMFAFMAYYGFQKTMTSFASNEARMGILELPVAPMRLAVVVAFTVLILLSVFYIIDGLMKKRIDSIVVRAEEHEAVA